MPNKQNNTILTTIKPTNKFTPSKLLNLYQKLKHHPNKIKIKITTNQHRGT